MCTDSFSGSSDYLKSGGKGSVRNCRCHQSIFCCGRSNSIFKLPVSTSLGGYYLRAVLQCERANSRYKAERRRVHELEEELTVANSKYRDVSRQLMDANDANDTLAREVNSLRVRSSVLFMYFLFSRLIRCL